MTAKRHHYNPQVYLRQFTNPKAKNELWEYDLAQGTASKSTPKLCGSEDYYHSLNREGGERDDDSIEKSFGYVENRLPKMFEVVRGQKQLSGDLWNAFYWFAAIQRARCPKVRNSVQSALSKLYQRTWEITKHTPAFEKAMARRGLDPEKVRDAEFDIKAEPGSTLLFLLTASEKLAHCFSQMNWSLLCAPPGKFFFTSDDPVCCWAPLDERGPFGDGGPESTEVEVTFPLSRRVCAYGRWKPAPPHYTTLPSPHLNGINFRTVLNGWRYLYGPTEDNLLIEMVQDSAKRRRAVPG